MKTLILAIATGFYSGRLPKAPGTWGSIAALFPWYFLQGLSTISYILMLIGVFIVGCYTAGEAEKIMAKKDAGPIVIDEFLGIFIALAFAPSSPFAWLLGFLFFRFFDILKPFPVSWFDSHMSGGLGIMMDDVIAGIYALLSLQLCWFILGALT